MSNDDGPPRPVPPGGHPASLSGPKVEEALGPLNEDFKFFVANLPVQFGPHELRTHFEPFGTVNYAKIIRDKKSGRSCGYGFLYMMDATGDAAVQAYADFNDHRVTIHGHPRVYLKRNDHGRAKPLRTKDSHDEDKIVVNSKIAREGLRPAATYPNDRRLQGGGYQARQPKQQQQQQPRQQPQQHASQYYGSRGGDGYDMNPGPVPSWSNSSARPFQQPYSNHSISHSYESQGHSASQGGPYEYDTFQQPKQSFSQPIHPAREQQAYSSQDQYSRHQTYDFGSNVGLHNPVRANSQQPTNVSYAYEGGSEFEPFYPEQRSVPPNSYSDNNFYNGDGSYNDSNAGNYRPVRENPQQQTSVSYAYEVGSEFEPFYPEQRSIPRNSYSYSETNSYNLPPPQQPEPYSVMGRLSQNTQVPTTASRQPTTARMEPPNSYEYSTHDVSDGYDPYSNVPAASSSTFLVGPSYGDGGMSGAPPAARRVIRGRGGMQQQRIQRRDRPY